jgi:UDP-glucose 4-epimerase
MTNARADGPVVVTGGAGAIGSVLVRALAGRGAAVRVIDRLSSGRRAQLPAPAPGLSVALTVADLARPSAWVERFEGAREVWHLAANPDIRRGTAEPRVDVENGALSTFHVLEAARRSDVPRVLFSSSSVVYGRASVFPTPEEYGPLLPESVYGAAKLASEGLVAAYAHTYGLQAWIFRFANIVDGRMNHGILYDLFEKLERDPRRLPVLGDGRQAKSYLRTEDCVRGMITASDRADGRVNLFNLGAVDRISVREIAEKVVAAHGGVARIVFSGGELGWSGDVPQQLLAIEKIRALGWAPSTSSAGAIDRTIEEMLEIRARPPAEGAAPAAVPGPRRGSRSPRRARAGSSRRSR